MTPAETAAFLRQFNEWRRGDEDIPQPDPRVIGEAIDAAVEMIDRLEAAEKDIAMKEEVIDSLATVIKRLDAQCDAAEKEREIDEKRIADLMADLNRVGHENDALRAKIEQMEKQEPVAWYSKQYGFVYMSRHSSQFEHGSILYLRNGTPAWRIEGSSRVALLNMASLPHGTVFYTLPGSKGEEK